MSECLVVTFHYVRDAASSRFPRLKALAVADFEAHLDDFPLQTFDLAHDQIVKQVAAANLKRDWDRYLQSLRTTATIVWARTELERAYREADGSR